MITFWRKLMENLEDLKPYLQAAVASRMEDHRGCGIPSSWNMGNSPKWLFIK